MYLILMRHGYAVDASTTLDDWQRYLTPKGKKQTKRMAIFLRDIAGAKPIEIYASPIVRAQETAQVIANELEIEKISKVFSLSRPEWEPVQEVLAQAPVGSLILMVSHQPFLEDWLQLLTGVNLEFKKSAMALISYEEEKARLLAYITPRALRDWKGLTT